MFQPDMGQLLYMPHMLLFHESVNCNCAWWSNTLVIYMQRLSQHSFSTEMMYVKGERPF